MIIERGQCIEVKNRGQYNKLAHVLKNGKPISYDFDWPIYFAVNPKGTIGIQNKAVDLWTNEPLEIVDINSL